MNTIQKYIRELTDLEIHNGNGVGAGTVPLDAAIDILERLEEVVRQECECEEIQELKLEEKPPKREYY